MSLLKKLIVGFLLIMAIFVAIGTVYGLQVYRQMEKAALDMHQPIEGREEAVVIENSEPMSLLLLGIANDAKRKTDYRANSIMVVTVHPENGRTTITSVPRDAYVEIVGMGYHDKINHAHSFGGTEMMVSTIESYLEVPIHHYLSINMDGLADLVDAIGGVTVDNQFAFTAENIDYPEGTLYLNGWEALQYTRMRKDDPEGDYGRQRRQREVTQIIAKHMISFSGVAQIPEFLSIIGDNGETDLTLNQMTRLFTQYQNALSEIELFQMAGEGFTGDGFKGEAGISYQEVSLEELNLTKERLQQDLQ